MCAALLRPMVNPSPPPPVLWTRLLDSAAPPSAPHLALSLSLLFTAALLCTGPLSGRLPSLPSTPLFLAEVLCLLFKNTAALLYIIHTDHPFNMYKSKVFSIFTYTCDTNRQFHTIFVTARITLYPLALPLNPSPASSPAAVSKHKPTFCIDWPVLDISHKRDQRMVFRIWLPSLSIMFPWFFSVLLCATSSSYCQVLFHQRLHHPNVLVKHRHICSPIHQWMGIWFISALLCRIRFPISLHLC